MSAQAGDPCDIAVIGTTPGCAVKDKIEGAADKVGTVVEFGQDPMAFIAQKEAEAAKSLTENIIPALTNLTQPDLTVDWFIDAYKISFAAAIFGWIVIMLWDLATFRGRGESGREVIDSFTKWTPVFIGGSMFGPAAGAFILKGIGYLNAALIGWGLSATDTEAVSGFNALVQDDPTKFLGGSFLAVVIYALLVLALLLVLVVMVIMVVTLYFSGVVLPLSLMWATKIGHREKGRKILMVWAGVLFSQPLIFLLLGFAFSGITDSMMDIYEEGSGTGGGASLANLIKLLVAIIMLAVATLGPTTLAAYAPVGPTDGAAAGPGLNARGAGRGGSTAGARGGAGPASPSSSQTSQVAQTNAARQGSSSMGAASTAGVGAGAAATGGTLLAAKAAKDGTDGLASKTSEMNEQAQGSNTSDAESQSSDGGRGSDRGTSSEASTWGQPTGSGTSGSAGRDGSSSEQGGGRNAGLAASASGNGQGQAQINDAQGSSGRGGSSLRSAAGKAGKLGARAAGLAQQAGDHAESQMDHHRDGARGRR